MNSSWQLKKFGECAELIRDTCLPGEVEAVPYIGLEHIEEGTLRLLGLGNTNNVISTKSRFETAEKSLFKQYWVLPAVPDFLKNPSFLFFRFIRSYLPRFSG